MDSLNNSVQDWIIRNQSTGDIEKTLLKTSFIDARTIFSNFDNTKFELVDKDYFDELIAQVMVNQGLEQRSERVRNLK